MSVSVLFVCTGNVCRSPTAELLFRTWAAPGADVQVSSAGTHALVGNAMDFSSAEALGELGIDPSAHRARQYKPWMAAEADLVLTAERAHRDLVLTELPQALHRTFTMNEFARLLPRTAPGAPADVIADAARIRGIDGAASQADDMPDPYRDEIARARTIADQISRSVRIALDALGLAASASPVAASVAAPALAPPPAPAPRRRPRPWKECG